MSLQVAFDRDNNAMELTSPTKKIPPPNWRVLQCKDCLKKVESKIYHPSIQHEHYQKEGTFPIIDQSSEYIAGWTDSNKSVIFENLPVIVFGDHTRVFKYIDFPFAVGADGTKILRANDNILDPLFFYFALVNLDIPNKGYNRHFKYLRELTISFPQAKSEQRAIAKVLRAVQQTIQTRRDELGLERERKAVLMEYLFSNGTRNETRKHTKIGELPEKWKLVELGEIITLHRGYDLPTRDRKPGTVPIISSSGMSGTHSEAKVTGPGVVTGRYGTLGEVFYIEQDFWPLNTTLYVSDFRGVSPQFIAYLLSTLNLKLFNDKTKVPGVNRNALHRIKTVLPDLSEQQEIVKVLNACGAKIIALEQELMLLDELFHAFLEEIITGRLSTLPLIEEGETHE